jgi:hypothetical protein
MHVRRVRPAMMHIPSRRLQSSVPLSNRPPVSAFVVAYNREYVIGTCLRALAFADEVIVVDKGSTDNTTAIAESLADRVIRVPWTPTVEPTRDFALSLCTHDWILFLDDDECLSPEAIRFIDAELASPRADIYKLAQRHYIMGLHDERAYYWPEHQMRLFRRGAVTFTDTVHDGSLLLSDRVHAVPPEGGVCIHHLSHRDVAQWIEKTNRYTSQPNRQRAVAADSSIGQFAHERIDHWLSMNDPCEPDGYPVVAALLRAIYDIVDRLKMWEEASGLDGTALFATECARLDAIYAKELADLARPRASAAEQPMTEAGALSPVGMAATMYESLRVRRGAAHAARASSVARNIAAGAAPDKVTAIAAEGGQVPAPGLLPRS